MSIYAGKIRLPFEPKMPVKLDVAGVTRTPTPLRPTLGTLSVLRYKPCRVAFWVKYSAQPTTGSASLNLYAGEEVIASASLDVVGAIASGGAFDVDLSSIAGETKLSVGYDVDGVGDDNITVEVDAYLDIDLPIMQSGC